MRPFVTVFLTMFFLTSSISRGIDIDKKKCKNSDSLYSARTQTLDDKAALRLVSLDDFVYLIGTPEIESRGNMDMRYFGNNLWCSMVVRVGPGDGAEDFRTTIRKVGKPWNYSSTSAWEALGYDPTGQDKRIRMVPDDKSGVANFWKMEGHYEQKAGSEKRQYWMFRATEGAMRGWYLSFGEPETIPEKKQAGQTVVPAHIRHPAILVKEPNELSKLHAITHFSDGK